MSLDQVACFLTLCVIHSADVSTVCKQMRTESGMASPASSFRKPRRIRGLFKSTSTSLRAIHDDSGGLSKYSCH